MSIVGDVNLERLRPDIEKYIASLPTGYITPSNNPQTYHKPYPREVSAQGEHQNKVFISYAILSPTNRNPAGAVKEELQFLIVRSILEKRLFDRLRGKNGLVYGVSVYPKFDILLPSSQLSMDTVADYKNHKKVLSLISDELTLLREKGVSQAELSETKIALAGEIKSYFDDNQNIADNITLNDLSGVDLYTYFENYPSILEAINTLDIKQAMAHYLNKSGESIATLIK